MQVISLKPCAFSFRTFTATNVVKTFEILFCWFDFVLSHLILYVDYIYPFYHIYCCILVINLFIYLSIHSYISLFIYRSIHSYFHLSNNLFISMFHCFPFIYLLLIYSLIHLYTYVSIHSSMHSIFMQCINFFWLKTSLTYLIYLAFLFIYLIYTYIYYIYIKH